MLRDEQQALQLAFTAMEDDMKKLKAENQQLVLRMIQFKAHDADVLNAENDREFRSVTSTHETEILSTVKLHI